MQRICRLVRNAWTTTCLGWFAVLLAPTLLRAEGDLSIFRPATPSAQGPIDNLIFVSTIIVGIFVVVQGAILWCVLHYRRKGPDDLDEPPQVYGSKPIEVAWTVAPTLVVFVLFLIAARTIFELRRDLPPGKPVEATVVGHQFWWEFRYPHLGIVTANELHLPLSAADGQNVAVLTLLSEDVVHSFWAPRLAGKTDLLPNQTNTMWFECPTEPEVFLGQCAEFCGTQHGKMLFRVIIDTPETFAAWIENEQKPAVAPDPAGDPRILKGFALFHENGCRNCHTIRGTNAAGTAGPDLTHLASRTTIAAGILERNLENLTQWIYDAQSIKPGCLMPSMHLSREESADIAYYLESLR